MANTPHCGGAGETNQAPSRRNPEALVDVADVREEPVQRVQRGLGRTDEFGLRLRNAVTVGVVKGRAKRYHHLELPRFLGHELISDYATFAVA